MLTFTDCILCLCIMHDYMTIILYTHEVVCFPILLCIYNLVVRLARFFYIICIRESVDSLCRDETDTPMA